MSAVGTMLMLAFVTGAFVIRRAFCAAVTQCVLINVIVVHVMQMIVVQIISVIVVFYLFVST
jgi:hypothetical protein